MTRVIEEIGEYRIIEMVEDYIEMDNLKGDCYNPIHNPDTDPEVLREQEKEFEQLVYGEGVYGYELQKWNPAIGAGWDHVDSCYGFIGQYENKAGSDFNHYIVEEMRTRAQEEIAK